MTVDIVIVDDEPLARQRLQRLLVELGYDVVAQAGSAEEAEAIILAQDPSLVLLDIEMPGENGLQLAEKIARLDAPPAIIFTTAYEQYALEAFDTLAAGYLLKPVQRHLLEKTLAKAGSLNRLQLESINLEPQRPCREHISAKSHRGVELIATDQIRYFLADQKYVMVVGEKTKVLIDDTLKELEREFFQQFVRVHRNALVSIKHIQGLEHDQQGHYSVCLEGIEEKPMVSRRYTSKIKALLQAL